MSENSRLPIFERWAEQYDQSVQTDKGMFASYSLILAEVVRAAEVKAGMGFQNLTGLSWPKIWDRPSEQPFQHHQILIRFAAPDEAITVPVHQDFGRAGVRVVVGGHDQAISPGVKKGQDIPRLNRGQQPLLSQKVG